MKKILFLLMPALLVLLGSCNKECILTEKHGPQTLPGAWELRSYYGGYGSTGGGDFEPGNGSIYSFTDNTYTYYYEGNPEQTGTYTLTTAPNPNTGEIMSAILFDGDYTVCYSIADNKLKIYSGAIAADGTVNTYVRVANAGEKIKQ